MSKKKGIILVLFLYLLGLGLGLGLDLTFFKPDVGWIIAFVIVWSGWIILNIRFILKQ
jgi:hypothetical protein